MPLPLAGGVSGKDYDFGEILPATISGKVFVDANNNGQFDQGEPLLPGVTIYLLDQSKTHIAVTQTDQNGEYFFTDLKPGTYGTEEVQPAGYFEGADYVGSVGGNLDGVDRIIDVPARPGRKWSALRLLRDFAGEDIGLRFPGRAGHPG